MPIRARKFFKSEAGILRILTKELKLTGGWAYLLGRLMGTVHFALIPRFPGIPAPPCPCPQNTCWQGLLCHLPPWRWGRREAQGSRKVQGERAAAGQQQQVTTGPAITASTAEGSSGPAAGITGSSLKEFSSSGPQFPSWKQRGVYKEQMSTESFPGLVPSEGLCMNHHTGSSQQPWGMHPVLPRNYEEPAFREFKACVQGHLVGRH